MSRYFYSAGFRFSPENLSVTDENGEALKVRPKTAQLLLLLVEAKGQILSKQCILEKVWSDVIVDEQVIFQSVKELRKIFAGQNLIKTYPRHGYAWHADVTEISDQEEFETAPVTPADRALGNAHRSNIQMLIPTRRAFAASLVCLLLVVSILSFHYLYKSEYLPNVSGSVIVLPVKTALSDIDHKWVKFGAMDQLIQQLSPADDIAVIQTDYVLDIMARAATPLDAYSKSQVANIFNVSGASLVIELQLTGGVRDYQLIYTFHRKTGLERGAVLSDSVQSAISQVAEIVARRLGQTQHVAAKSYDSVFANEMLANALVANQLGNQQESISLLAAVTTTHPEYLPAKRMLAAALLEQGENSRAQQLLEAAIRQAQKTQAIDKLARLNFYLGISHIQQGEFARGISILESAKPLAHESKDWLFSAYISEVMGRALQFQQKFSLAQDEFEEAMTFHKIVQCPFGQSNVLMHMSNLAFQRGDPDSALTLATNALQMTQARGLDDLTIEAQALIDAFSSG